MPDISDQELARLRGLEAMVNKLEGDPRSNALIEQAVKIHHPEVRTQQEVVTEAINPVLAPVNETLAAVQAQLKEIADERKALAESAATNSLNSTFASLQSQHGFTDDGLTKIKELMVERKIADPEAAAALFLQQNPPKPTDAPAWQPSNWDIGSTAGANAAPDMKELFENEDAWADKTAAQTLNSIRLGQSA